MTAAITYIRNRHNQALSLGLQVAYVRRDYLMVSKIARFEQEHNARAYGHMWERINTFAILDNGERVKVDHLVLTNQTWVERDIHLTKHSYEV